MSYRVPQRRVQDLVTFKALLRTDGDLIDTTGAIKHYVGNAA